MSHGCSRIAAACLLCILCGAAAAQPKAPAASTTPGGPRVVESFEVGVTRYDGRDWRSFRRRDGLLESNVYALAAASGGNLWAGTKRGVARIAAR